MTRFCEGSDIDTWLVDWEVAFINRLYGHPDTHESVAFTDRRDTVRVPDKSEAFAALETTLTSQANVTDLYRMAASDDFKRQVGQLDPAEVKMLRAVYHETQQRLDGKVRLDMFDGQILHLIGVEAWHSDEYDNDGVTLHFRPERDPDKTYKALTSSARIVRFCSQLRDMPTEKAPVRILVELTPITSGEGKAKGWTQWNIKQLPMPRARNTEGSPF